MTTNCGQSPQQVPFIPWKCMRWCIAWRAAEDLPLRCPEPQARTDADGRLRTAVVTTGLGQDLGQASVCFILSAIFHGRAGSH